MTAIGGTPQEASVAGRAFGIAADSGAPRKLGGKENTLEPNGNGTGRIIQKVTPGKVTLKLSIDDAAGDLEFLQDLVNSAEYFPFSYTEVSGITYSASETQITGEVVREGESATSEVTFEWTGRAEQQ